MIRCGTYGNLAPTGDLRSAARRQNTTSDYFITTQNEQHQEYRQEVMPCHREFPSYNAVRVSLLDLCIARFEHTDRNTLILLALAPSRHPSTLRSSTSPTTTSHPPSEL